MLISIPLWEFELHNHITTTRAPDQPHIARPRQTAILPTILISAVVASALFCSEPDMTKYMLLVVYSFPRLNCQKELVKFRYFRLKSIANSFPPQGTNSPPSGNSAAATVYIQVVSGQTVDVILWFGEPKFWI